MLSLADTTRAQQIKLERIGFYEVYTPNGEQLIGVNVDPRESALAAAPPEALGEWRGATRRQEAATARPAAATAGQPFELWPWLLLLFALVLVAESILGNAHLATRAKA